MNEIIALDKEARLRVEKAHDEQLRIHRETEEAETKLRSELFERETKRLAIARDTQNKKISEKTAELDAEKLEYIARLDKIIGENKNAWQSEIFDRITGA